jgi:hypothetical protein
MDERERRIGQNEALFRQVNERLRDLNEAFGAVTNRIELICECADRSCAERISLSLAEYENLRSTADWFIVARGHAVPTDIEEVIRTGDGWEIIRKRAGGPAKLAKATNPRS